MKTVFIVRHAKSSWDNPLVPDVERPLLEKGRKRTQKIVEFLHKSKVTVDLIICSHATRAQETAHILADGLDYPRDAIRIDPSIYAADGERLYDEFYDLPEKATSVMIIGHNPALTDFVNDFLHPPIDNLPTSGVVVIDFDTARWEEVATSPHQVRCVVFPKIIHPMD